MAVHESLNQIPFLVKITGKIYLTQQTKSKPQPLKQMKVEPKIIFSRVKYYFGP